VKWFGKKGVGPLQALRALRALRKGVEEDATDLCNADRAIRNLAHTLSIDEKTARQMAMDLTLHVFEGLSHCFYPIPGAYQLVEGLKDEFDLILATNPVWPREVVEIRLKWAGVPATWFRFISSNETMHSCKPSLNYYRELIERQNLDPAHSLMIGDSKKKDLPARDTGMSVFLLSNSKDLKKMEERVWTGNFPSLIRLIRRPSETS
jgi:FMN phosphatase YigB (HAD superfamily)